MNGMLFMVCALLVAGLMPVLIGWLRRRAILDIPNERSSHTVPTPRGGGWLVLGVPTLGLLLTAYAMQSVQMYAYGTYALVAALFLLMVVSAIDDRKGLPPFVRLLVQAMAALLVVGFIPADVQVFDGLPPRADRALWVLGLIWMMNLTNFIDGIDGITALNGLVACAGFTLAAAAAPLVPASAALLSGALLGFLVWNRPPAKVFLGDVGSIPLGLWLGTVLIYIADAYGLVPALLIVFYPLADASWTLLCRLRAGEKIWQAHRSHFYQQAVQNGFTPFQTVWLIFLFSLVCLFFALIALATPALHSMAFIGTLGTFLILVAQFKKGPTGS